MDNIVAITSATLRLFTLFDLNGDVKIDVVAGDWDENEVTWDDAPTTIGPRSAKTLKSRESKSNSWYQVDITDAVVWSAKEMGQSFVTVRISTRKKARGRFASREYEAGKFSPKLVLKFGETSIRPSTPRPTPRPTSIPKPKPSKPTHKPLNNSNKPSSNKPNPENTTSQSAARALEILADNNERIDNELFLFESPLLGQFVPSTVYQYGGLAAGLKLMNTKGVAGKRFYLGDDSANGHIYGLINVAAFLAQSMKETIKYNACDENNWDLLEGIYPLSNACGQLGQSYQDYHCSQEEKHMECPVDKNMRITAVTHASWYGAPGMFVFESFVCLHYLNSVQAP